MGRDQLVVARKRHEQRCEPTRVRHGRGFVGRGLCRGRLHPGGGFFTASGLTVNNVARWDGAKWNPVGAGITAPGPSVVVYSLAVRGTELFAGTEIGTSGGQSMPYVVRWDGANWSPIASTLD